MSFNTQKRKYNFERIKNNPIFIIIAAACTIVSFIEISFRIRTFGQDLVPHGSYKFITELEKDYVLKSVYNQIFAENKELKLSIEEKNAHIVNSVELANAISEWKKEYNSLKKERDGFERELNNFINLSRGVLGADETLYKLKKEELLRKISVRDEQISSLLNVMESFQSSVK